MSSTTRYFKACDRLDIARETGSQHRINCLTAMVDKLGDESAEQQVEDYYTLKNALISSIKEAFGHTIDVPCEVIETRPAA